MDLQYRIALSKVRLDYSKDALDTAQTLLKLDKYKDCANRSYYAIFHAMRAVLALDGIDRKKHSGVIAEFRRLYIKTGIFSTEMSDIINDLFVIRMDSDYKDFYILPKKDVKDQLKNAKVFIKNIEKYLKLKYNQPVVK